MLKTLTPLLGAALLAVSSSLLAQSPAGPGPRAGDGPRARFDCSKAKDPKACEERRDKVRAAHDKARQACDGKQGTERGDCMRKEMCAQSPDPAKCEARVKEGLERRKQVREACQGKQGDELRACVREQRAKQRPEPKK